jgi:hypothetical protein
VKYSLSIPGLDEAPNIEITKVEFDDFERSRNILSNALAIEEKYEILIANYVDFEKQILNMTADYMVRGPVDHSHFFDIRLNLNIRLVNLLTAARLYVDQLSTHVQECIPNVPITKEQVKSLFSKEYDENQDYRFMEALRNYVQHRGLPVHWTKQGFRWTSSKKDGLLEYSIDMASQLSDLAEDDKFKKKVLAELPENIDLKLATRCYVESISNVHESVRNMIADSVKSAREVIENAHRRYEAVYSEKLSALCACKFSNGNIVSGIHLFLGMDDVRLKLQKRNRKLGNLKKRYVTSSIKTSIK